VSSETSSNEFATCAAALAPDFALQREIGRGGMGVVYLAQDVKLDRPVAIKVLPELLAEVPAVRERFLREARTAAKLSHPNIVPIFRADETRGVVSFVMAYIDGGSLADRLAARGPLPASEVAPLLRDVALALDFAHGHGIVHRDIKPENILVEGVTGRALVTDFGIARLAEAAPLTATGQVLGTVHYMSPEQVSAEPLDGRSDLYSLGVVGFRALTGRFPFDSETASAILVAHVTKPPPRMREAAPQLPAAIATVIDGCLAKEPGARYQSGAALARVLDDALDEMNRDPAHGAVEPPVISEREAQALWALAAELQAETGLQRPVRAAAALAISRLPSGRRADGERRSLTSGYRFDDVRRAAIEAGISEHHVSRAAADLGLAPAPKDEPGPPALIKDQSPPGSPWAGRPMAIVFEAQVSGELPESELDILVDIIRRRVGDAGQVGTLGRSVSWSSTSPRRRVQVAIMPRAGKTTIRVDERLSMLAGGLFGGIVGGVGGGSGGLAIGIGVGALHSAAAVVGIWGVALAGSYLLARTIYVAQARSRERELRALIEELASQARDSILTVAETSDAPLTRERRDALSAGRDDER
jgi:serine/threonine-protein kinase